MDLEKVRVIIEDKYAELTSQVIEILKQISLEIEDEEGKETTLGLWEDFVDLMQNDQELEYTEHDDTIEDACRQCLADLSRMEIKLLWLGSGGSLEWDGESEEPDFPPRDKLLEDVVDELFSWVEQKAVDDDLEVETHYLEEILEDN